MKKLFAILLSFHLIVFPVVATAQSNTPGTEEDAYKTSGAGSKGGYDFYTSQILALATSAVGTSILTSCMAGFKVPSIIIYFGGSVAHIASEFLGAKSSNEDHTKRLKDLSIKEADLVSKGDSAQKAVLEQRLTEEKATLKFLNNRKIWMTAVSVIYAAAMGVAIFEATVNDIPPTPATPNPFYKMFSAGCKPGSSGINWGTLLSVAYGMGTSRMGNGGPTSQYGTMLISLMGIVVPSVSSAISGLYSEPIPRIATFGAAFALAGTVTSGLYIRAGKAQSNIEKLEKVIAQFKVNSEGTETGIETADIDSSDSDTNAAAKKQGKLKTLTIDKKKECISLAGDKPDISSAACSKTLKIAKANTSSLKFPAINNVSGLTADMANALASGDEAKAASIAGEIGSYAARVNTETDALKVAYNEIQKKNNKPIMDFDKNVKDQVASLQGSLSQGASAKGINLADAAASSTLSPEAAKPADAPMVTTSAPTSTPVVEANIPNLSMDSGTEVTDMPAVAAKAEQNLDDFESTEQDISKKPEVSIFKQLSNRYILNYTKMFEAKKKPEAVEEPAKN